MRSRSILGSAFLFAFAIPACANDSDRDWGYASGNDNEIVFGIRQSTDAAGKTTTEAGYEYLSLARHGGWDTDVLRDGRAACWFERFEHRLGNVNVESGVAVYRGGRLPGQGLTLLANQPKPTALDGAAWAAGDTLTFEANGFAMPSVPPLEFEAPLTTLAITAPEATPSLAIAANQDLTVAWSTDGASRNDRVVVALRTDEGEGAPGGEVRCFYGARDGRAVLESKWISQLFASVNPALPLKGTLLIASHRQLTIDARGGWVIYVVASTDHRSQPFTGTR